MYFVAILKKRFEAGTESLHNSTVLSVTLFEENAHYQALATFNYKEEEETQCKQLYLLD